MRAVSLLAFNSDLKNIDTGDNPVYAYKDGILFCEGTETFCKNSRELKDEVSVDGMWADFADTTTRVYMPQSTGGI